MRFQFHITENKELRIWDRENPNPKNAPVIFQPNWPDGTDWASKEEAEAWANVFIESIINSESEFIPGLSPDEPKRLRPKPEPKE